MKEYKGSTVVLLKHSNLVLEAGLLTGVVYGLSAGWVWTLLVAAVFVFLALVLEALNGYVRISLEGRNLCVRRPGRRPATFDLSHCAAAVRTETVKKLVGEENELLLNLTGEDGHTDVIDCSLLGKARFAALTEDIERFFAQENASSLINS